jgi:hypothetical protein
MARFIEVPIGKGRVAWVNVEQITFVVVKEHLEGEYDDMTIITTDDGELKVDCSIMARNQLEEKLFE